MKLIIGIGNPGEKYKNNRHNVGFMVLDTLAKKLGIEKFVLSQGVGAHYAWTSLKGVKIELFKPQTFMNNSGFSVKYAYKKHSLSPHDLFVIHDDLDLPLGGYKIQKGKGPIDHKGLLSIYDALGTKDFWHVRVGVDNRKKGVGEPSFAPPSPKWLRRPSKATEGKDYVLQDFSEEELKVLNPAIDKIVRDLINHVI